MSQIHFSLTPQSMAGHVMKHPSRSFYNSALRGENGPTRGFLTHPVWLFISVPAIEKQFVGIQTTQDLMVLIVMTILY